MSLPFFLEIGTEELPASYLPNYARQMKEDLDSFLTSAMLEHKEVVCAWTPRRLAFFCEAVAETQAVKESDVKGPPVAVSFKDGQPTKAAISFAAKVGLPIESVGRVEENGREYLFARVKEGGNPASELLKNKIPELIRGLRSPKSMRWDVKPTTFARPIRSLCCLLGNELIDCDLDGLRASRDIKGHRFLAPGPFEMKTADFAEYEKSLKEHFVILSFEERRNIIKEQLLKFGCLEERLDEELIDICANLTEYPNCVKGDIAPEYLELPPEVLITTLKKHQKSFPCYDAKGGLEAAFLSVTNNDLKEKDLIKTGYERVISARLSDARFFFNEDKEVTLRERRERLKTVVFQKDIGTYFSKTERVSCIATKLGEMTGKEEAAEIAADAALISRSDLTTAMVFEFPELQGIMGRIYAERVDKVSPGEALAIEEMYKPRSAGDDLPETLPGAILSIADKIDTIIGCVTVGLAPTGSADPYMLRRQTFGLLKTIIAHKLSFKLSALVKIALELLEADSDSFKKNIVSMFTEKMGVAAAVQENELGLIAESWFAPHSDEAKLEKQISSLFTGRFETVLKEEGISYDIIQAVFGSPWPDILVTSLKAKELQEMKKDPEFLTLCNMLTRCVNIAKDEKKGKAAAEVDPALFTEKEEKELWSAWESVKPEAHALLENCEFGKAVKLIASKVAEPLDKFFTFVRIYADDKSVASNRLAVLKSISDTIQTKIADLSKVVTA
jgi:glycyl-tRNA synthetase beta chain